MRRVALAIGVGLGIGKVRYFPGTAGTLWGVLVYIIVALLGASWWWYIGILAVVFLAGVWASGRCEVLLGQKDHPSIVIDEVAGLLITLLGISFSPLALIVGFGLFRLFDIVKPFSIRRLQALPGGWGVMVDDVAAGLAANLVLRLIFVASTWVQPIIIMSRT